MDTTFHLVPRDPTSSITLCCNYPDQKCPSASIVMTSTLWKLLAVKTFLFYILPVEIFPISGFNSHLALTEMDYML